MATFDDFMKLDIRVGTITDAHVRQSERRLYAGGGPGTDRRSTGDLSGGFGPSERRDGREHERSSDR